MLTIWSVFGKSSIVYGDTFGKNEFVRQRERD